MSHQSAYLSSVLMYLLSFLGIFFNDSMQSLSELHIVTFNIQQMYLAHVQFLLLTDGEFFILSVLPGTRGIFSEMLSVDLDITAAASSLVTGF